MDRRNLRDRYWSAILTSLGFSLAGVDLGTYVALGIGLAQMVHVIVDERSATTLPSQVRIAYLGLLVAGFPPQMRWLHALQVAGTVSLLFADYCPLARMLSLFPWNLGRRASMADVVRAAVLPPAPGSFVERLRSTEGAATGGT